jgi:integrase
MARQPNGESKIYLGADGGWHTYVTVGRKPDGALDRRHIRGQTATEVKDKRDELKAKLRIGHVPEVGKSPTLAEWLEHWLTVIAPEKVRGTTLQGYESKVRFRLIPALGGHRLAKLTAEHVGMYFAGLRREVAPATRLQLFRILSRALKVAVQRGKIPRNPCDLLDPPTADRDEVKPISAVNTTRLLDAAGARDPIALARWLIALVLGMRQGEVLGLKWEFVDLDGDVPTIRVRWALARLKWRHGCADPCGRRPASCPDRHGGGLQVVEVKSKKSRRTLPLPPNIVTALRVVRKLQREARMAAGARWIDNGLVFTDRLGRPLDPRRDWGAWKQLLIDCEIGVVERTASRGRRAGELYEASTVRVHDARHSAATSMRALGMDLREVMEWLGHSQISVTSIYTHIPPEVMQERARQLGALYVLQPDGATKRGRRSS